MKRLRMIVTSIIIIVIVGSAFAFNAIKCQPFCYSTLGTNTCDATFANKEIVTTGGTTFHYYNGWKGLVSDCTAPGNQNCSTTAKFVND